MPDGDPTRRHVLAATGSLLGSIAVAGCLQDDSGGQGGTTTADATSTATTTATGTSSGAGTTTDETTTQRTTVENRPGIVTFEAPHGADIKGTLYGRGDCGIVLVPQINLDRGSWKPHAERLAEQEFLVLAIDEDPDNRPASVQGAISFLREQHGVSSLVLIGASSGGEAVVVANANAPDGAVDGTIALSPGGGSDHASDLQGRTLFVVSKSDDDRFVQVANDLHEGAPEPTNLVTYDGSAHGQRILESDHGEDLKNRIREFLQAACGS